MKSQDLPAPVRRFLLTSIPSVPYLEAVLLLRGAPASAWTAADLARRLYVAEPVAAELLRSLASAGIAQPAEVEGAFTYAPATPELSAMLEEVAQVYARDLVQVSDLIHSRVDRRAQQFADAFRWRKDS